MSKHHNMQYYVKANGEHVISWRVFRAMHADRLCNILGINLKTNKVKKEKKA